MDLSHSSSATDEQVESLSGLLVEQKNELSVLNEEIAKLRGLLADREDKAKSISHIISTYEALLSPMRRLPVDILREIFVQCLSPKQCAPMHIAFAPLLLVRICRPWREVALTTPRLWATIHIALPSIRPMPTSPPVAEFTNERFRAKAVAVMKERAEAAKTWLSRSGACPVDISIYERVGRSEPENEILRMLLNAIVPSMNRWRKLVLNMSTHGLDMLSDIIGPSQIGCLEEISVDECYTRALSPPATPVEDSPDGNYGRWATNSGILAAPALTYVTVQDLNHHPASLKVTWSQLTSLEFTRYNCHVTAGEVFKILKQCPLLVSCKIDFPGSQTRWRRQHHQDPEERKKGIDRNLAPISMIHLKDMAFIDGGHNLTPYFSMMETPQLESFYFVHAGDYWHSPDSDEDTNDNHSISNQKPTTRTTLSHILIQATSILTTLKVDSRSFSEKEFMSYLRLCPLLSTLHLVRSEIVWGISRNSPVYSPGDAAPPLDNLTKANPPMCINEAFLRMLTTEDHTGEILCPNLTDFEIGGQAQFSDEALLDFITRKQKEGVWPTPCDSPLSLKKLTKLGIRFQRERNFPDNEEGDVEKMDYIRESNLRRERKLSERRFIVRNRSRIPLDVIPTPYDAHGSPEQQAQSKAEMDIAETSKEFRERVPSFIFPQDENEPRLKLKVTYMPPRLPRVRFGTMDGMEEDESDDEAWGFNW